MSEESYYRDLLRMLEQIGPSPFNVKVKRTAGALCGGAAAGTITGSLFGAVGAVPGVLIGGLGGLALSWRWTTEHARLLAALGSKPLGEQVRIVGVVQGVVGGSRDIKAVENFINEGGSNKLLKALKENLN